MLEQVHDTYDDIRQMVERSNAWFARERRTRPGDYVNGKSYLDWVLAFTAFGRWHKIGFHIQKLDGIIDDYAAIAAAWQKAEAKIARRGRDDQALVLVHDVGLVKSPEGVIPSLVGLTLPAYVHCYLAGFLDPIDDHFLNVGRYLGKREMGVVKPFSARLRTGADKVIQGGVEVMERVSYQPPDLDWRSLFQLDFKAVLPRLVITDLPNGVSVAAEEGVNEKVDLLDVRLRALDL